MADPLSRHNAWNNVTLRPACPVVKGKMAFLSLRGTQALKQRAGARAAYRRARRTGSKRTTPAFGT